MSAANHQASSSSNPRSTTAAATTAITSTTCSYHSQVLSMSPNSNPQDLSPMTRFLYEGPAEQSALFIRADNGGLSINKGCSCSSNASGKQGTGSDTGSAF
ncbi:hypothetical protein P280DRAFT_534836 [Massarina eburnea CBS 473.64]|uniref:Uncharacterized protein n=1 Tax=Massarina eburnea CBS 473.64 TaxID=1395130 RepID=A0A6A6SC44_9PLEO|nr:hypothetical protein P280DRAFT_534836 [Massarina eburnea CBS 473.64]